MLTKKQKEEFADNFVTRYLNNGFGTIPKKEIDLLVYHLISESSQIKGKSNYHVANLLRITESRVKALKLEASIKYKPANTKAILGDIVDALVKEMKKPDFTGNTVTISLEDPVYKREFEQAIKDIGHHVEYGINRELLKIHPIHLLEVIIANIEHGEQEFITLVRRYVSEQDKQKRIIDKSLSLRQKINRLGEEVSSKSGLIGILAGAGLKLFSGPKL